MQCAVLRNGVLRMTIYVKRLWEAKDVGKIVIMIKYTADYIKEFLNNKYGYEYITGEFTGVKSVLTCKDKDGYYLLCNIDKMVHKGTKSKIIHSLNPYSIQNINRFIELNTEGQFICTSDSYTKNNKPLDFYCKRCGNTFKNKWMNICRGRYRNSCGYNKTGLFCPFCDAKQLESTHALVLKQIWLHENPDTIVEEKSCVNPNTNCYLPTDIVNHRLKIAIEVQSWFHDFKDQKVKDKIKREYWIGKGYSFYAVDQRDYSVLEIVQIFFPNINELPSYIDFNYSNKFNDVLAQKLLNETKSVVEVSKKMNCSPHLIYDAINCKRISYPPDYVNNSYTEVVQMDLNGNYIGEFNTISSAEKKTGVKGISYVLRKGRNYCGGYYWAKKNDYYSGKYKIIKTRLKIS